MDGLDVSDQHLLDCAYGYDDFYANGCEGAWGHIYAKWYTPYMNTDLDCACRQSS